MADERRLRRSEQAEIDAEEAATRRREAGEALERLRAVGDAVARRDPGAVAEAAAELHRVHALHEQRQGRRQTAREAVGRGVRARLRALQLRGRVSR